MASYHIIEDDLTMSPALAKAINEYEQKIAPKISTQIEQSDDERPGDNGEAALPYVEFTLNGELFLVPKNDATKSSRNSPLKIRTGQKGEQCEC